MKKIIKGKTPTSLENEIVPIQDFIQLTIDGIPQEVIDEIYDEFEDVKYSNYKKKVGKKATVYTAEYVEHLDDGEYSFQNEKWGLQQITGSLMQRYDIVGEILPGNIFDLLTVYSYNTIRKH